LFSVLYGLWVANYVALDVNVILGLATHFQMLALNENAAIPLMIADRLLGTSLLFSGDIARAKIHYDRAIGAYRPSEHRYLATKFGQDNCVAALVYRALTSWILGYPKSALEDVDRAVGYARELDNATTLMYALVHTPFTHFLCGDYAAALASSDELVTLADQKGAFFWKAYALVNQACHVALTSNCAEAIELLSSRIAAFRSTGATLFAPWYLPYLARAHSSAGNLDEALRCMGEALRSIEATGEQWCEAEAYRIAGEIVLNSATADLPQAEVYFARALSTARQQRARSWELRAATSLAGLWRGQGKRIQAHDLLAPVYGWFTEGLDTLDLRQAKMLLDALAS
jgi:predicted ATPase